MQKSLLLTALVCLSVCNASGLSTKSPPPAGKSGAGGPKARIGPSPGRRGGTIRVVHAYPNSINRLLGPRYIPRISNANVPKIGYAMDPGYNPMMSYGPSYPCGVGNGCGGADGWGVSAMAPGMGFGYPMLSYGGGFGGYGQGMGLGLGYGQGMGLGLGYGQGMGLGLGYGQGMGLGLGNGGDFYGMGCGGGVPYPTPCQNSGYFDQGFGYPMGLDSLYPYPPWYSYPPMDEMDDPYSSGMMGIPGMSPADGLYYGYGFGR